MQGVGFDFVECATRAYGTIWARRREIFRLCGAVVLFKIMSVLALVLLDMDQYKLRQGLFLLPAYFLEGWAIALIMAGSINALSGGPIDYDRQKRNAIAGAITYTLVKLMVSFLMGMALEGAQFEVPQGAPSDAAPQLQQNTPAEALGISVFMTIFLIWSFKFLWVYVPVSLGYGIEAYVSRFKKFSASFYMIGAWLLCLVPFMAVLMLFLELLRFMFPGDLTGDMALIPMVLSGTAQAIIDFAASLVSSVALAYGIHSVFTGTNKPPKLF